MARDAYYAIMDIPSKYMWNSKAKAWKERRNTQKAPTIGRVYFVSPSVGELYYMRMLLNHVKGPQGFEELRTVDGVVKDSFKEACLCRGLLEDDKD
jgi:hypothetical protein